MLKKTVSLETPVRCAEFTVREDHTLAVKMQLGQSSRTLVFHDFIRKAGKRFYLFNSKTEILARDDTVTVRTAAVNLEDGAPIPGLLVTYRFTFDREVAAFYL